MKTKEYDKYRPLVLSKPVDIQTEFAVLEGHVFNKLKPDIQEFLHTHAAFHGQKKEFDSVLNDVADQIRAKYSGAPGYGYDILSRLKWSMHFIDVWPHDGMRILQRFVSFTAKLDVAVDQSLSEELSAWIYQVGREMSLNVLDFEDGIVYSFAFPVSLGSGKIQPDLIDYKAMQLPFGDYPSYYNDNDRISPIWAALVCKAFSPPKSTFDIRNKELAVTQQESNGKTYYTLDTLGKFFRETVAPDEYINVMQFVTDTLANWSKHLALNTHKKQTPDTPRFSLQEGPGILTVLLERGDLERGERAPKVQMIFAADGKGYSITQRKEGGLVTTRMFDTFDQITQELQAGETVYCSTLEQITTYIGQVAAGETTSQLFRDNLGNPKQALLDAGDESDVYFIADMHRNQLGVRALAPSLDGSEDRLLAEVTLENVGTNGKIVLEYSPNKSAMNQALAQVEDAHHSSTYAPVWKEVRDVKADAEVPAQPTREIVPTVVDPVGNDALPHGPIRKIKDVTVSGDDEDMLKIFLERLLLSNLSMRDSRALVAFKDYVLGGEGLANLDHWSFVATITAERTEEEQDFLVGNNNAYVFIFNEDIDTPSAAMLTFQCQVLDS